MNTRRPFLLTKITHFNSELSTNSAENQSASADSSEEIEVDKKLVEYKVGEEVNCFVKSVCLTACFSLYLWLIECRFSSSIVDVVQ